MTRIRYILSAAFFTAAALGSTVLAAGCASGGPAVQARLGSPPARPGRGEIYLVPNFRIGWYDTMQRPETPARLAAAGYDTVMPYIGLRSKEVVRTFLDAAEKAGIGVHLDIPSAPVRDKDGRALEEFILAFRDSPAVLSWYLYDEPEWKPAVRPWVLRRAYKRIKALDPGRPIALVFMFPFLAPPYRGAMDAYWIDHYPVLRGSPEFAAFRDGLYADKMKAFGRSADRMGLPFTFVAQGYGEREDGVHQFRRRLPTPAEARYMFWASFLARPVELLYWALYRTREAWFRDVLTPLVAEFRGLFPDAVEYRPADGFRIDGGRADAIVLGDGRGTHRLLVLGREARGRTLRIEAPEGHTFRVGVDGQGRTAVRELAPHGVLLLELAGVPRP